MKKYNGCSSETKKCLFCGKNTNDYVNYEVKGIELRINTHYKCFKSVDNIAKDIFKLIKKDIREQ